MKIIALEAENVKRLVAVQIRPDGNLVEITGRNGQGKTSVLDCIWWALGSATHIQAAPIRKGEDQARIRLDLGEIIVTRTFKERDDGSVATSLTVENADGARFPSPQKMLDSLIGELSFDPLAFTRMDAGEQYEALKTFVPDVDFDAIDAANKADYEARTDVNREAKRLRTLADQIDVDAALADREPADESALIAEVEKAATHNAAIETRKARREQAQDDANRAAQTAAQDRERAAELRRQADAMEKQAEEQEAHAASLQKKIDEAEPLPAPIDTAQARAAVDEARRANAEIERARQKAAHIKAAEEAEGKSKALTAAMEQREADKRKAVAEAKLPVDGLGFGEGEILLSGLPFNQASDAEQLRTSIAIAMASNPKLRVIRVRDGSLLDEEAMALLGEMADGADYQVWIERVDSTGRIGFVLEDGHVRQAQAAEAAE